MDKQSESFCTVFELWTKKKVMLMAQTPGSGLMVRINVGVQAEGLVEVFSQRKFPTAGVLLQVAMQQGVSCVDFPHPEVIRASVPESCGHHCQNNDRLAKR